MRGDDGFVKIYYTQGILNVLTYETIFICRPELSEEQVGEIVEKTKQLMSKEGVEVLQEERLGRRKLIYPIRRAREGYYVQIRFSAPGQFLARLDRYFQVSDQILRALTSHWKPKSAEKVKEVKERSKA